MVQRVCRVRLLELGQIDSRRSVPETDELVGVRIWQRLEKNSLDHGEDGSVGADTDREREHGDHGESRCSDQLSNDLTELAHR